MITLHIHCDLCCLPLRYALLFPYLLPLLTCTPFLDQCNKWMRSHDIHVIMGTRLWLGGQLSRTSETSATVTIMTSPESDDVFQDEQPTIVDGDLIEAAKENIQPLATGRRATTLSAVLSTPHAQREAKLSAVRNRLRINLEIALEDEDDNPLEAYCQLVYWTLENYPQGHSAESGLLELLEEATRVLKDHRGGIWRTDLRYLKLWVLYANYVERPTVIYRYLLANEIGTNFALLYEEFATVLERNGRYELFSLQYRSQALDATQTRGRRRNVSPWYKPPGIPGRAFTIKVSRISEAHDDCHASGGHAPTRTVAADSGNSNAPQGLGRVDFHVKIIDTIGALDVYSIFYSPRGCLWHHVGPVLAATQAECADADLCRSRRNFRGRSAGSRGGCGNALE